MVKRKFAIKITTIMSIILLLVALPLLANCGPAEKGPPPTKPTPVTLAAKEAALLVIDTENDMLDEKGAFAVMKTWKYAEEHDTVKNIAKAIDLAEKQGIPVIRVLLHFRAGWPECPDRGMGGLCKAAKSFVEGTWGTEITPGLEIKEGQLIVEKTRLNAFYNTDLETLLRGLGVTTVLISGVSSTGCVGSTIYGAVDRDYNIIMLSDCVAGPPGATEYLLEHIWPSAGKVMTASEAFASLK